MINQPSTTTTAPWLYKNHHKPQSNLSMGKWLLFYDIDEINEQWLLVKILLDNNKLTGIHQIKCATAQPNPRGSGGRDRPIILHTESDDKNELLAIGRNIKKLMNVSERIYYKTDEQTLAGTRTTGQLVNHTLYC
jgi:hypothetical protein